MMSLVKTAAILAVAGVGCSGPNAFTLSGLGERFKQSLGMAEPPGRSIQRIDAIWKPAKGHDMKGMPCRGAAGQILFFAPGGEAPVKLAGEGKVVVYVFDNLGKPEEQAKPIHKFMFDIGAWNRHLQVGGQLGPTYHVFIPYTRKVVTAAQMSISVRLIPARGHAASSDIISVALPGPNPAAKTKLHVVSEPSRKKVNVSTFRPDKYLNGQSAPAAPTADETDSGSQLRSSAEFHDFDLNRKTQVRSLGPMRQIPPAETMSQDELRAKQNEQLEKLLAAFPKHPAGRAQVNANHADRRNTAAAPQQSFRLTPAPGAAPSRRVVNALHNRAADAPHPLGDAPAATRHPLLDEPATGPQN